MLEPGELAFLAGAGAIGAGAAVWRWWRKRADPEEKERLRRLSIHHEGRLGAATVVDASDNVLFYTYSIRGVEYAASQDVSAFRNRLPEELGSLIGPATVKYVPRNPFNSILICEEWSGFRKQESSRKGA